MRGMWYLEEGKRGLERRLKGFHGDLLPLTWVLFSHGGSYRGAGRVCGGAGGSGTLEVGPPRTPSSALVCPALVRAAVACCRAITHPIFSPETMVPAMSEPFLT